MTKITLPITSISRPTAQAASPPVIGIRGARVKAPALVTARAPAAMLVDELGVVLRYRAVAIHADRDWIKFPAHPSLLRRSVKQRESMADGVSANERLHIMTPYEYLGTLLSA